MQLSVLNSRKVCLVIGDPVSGSLSPLMHNSAYIELGIEQDFVFLASHVTPELLEDAVKGIRALGIRGISCTMPHKESIIRLLDSVDPIARKIGAVNTVVNHEGQLHGVNTDWLGIIRPIEEICTIKGKKVAILGAGGAARAACYGFSEAGAEITILNRNSERAAQLTSEFGGSYHPISEMNLIKECDIVLNTIPYKYDNKTLDQIIKANLINQKHIVFDIVYNPLYTDLIRAASQANAHYVFGLEMFIHQGAEQFRLYTGRDAPISRMRQVVLDFLSGESL